MNQADKDWIRGNSAEVIGGTGETIVRRRLDTSEKPGSWDDDYGEATERSEEKYLEMEFVGKVFWNPKEEQVAALFGARTEGAAIVHVPAEVDVRTGDDLVIGGATWRVGPVKPAPLGGFLEAGITRT